MGYIIRNIETNVSSEQYDTVEDAKTYVMSHIEDYKKGFEVIIPCTGEVVYEESREEGGEEEEVSRIDLIDLD